jgi:hypothetical protein
LLWANIEVLEKVSRKIHDRFCVFFSNFLNRPTMGGSSLRRQAGYG